MKIRTISLVSAFVVGEIFIGAVFAPAQAANFTNDFNVTVAPGQFENNILNDVWRSPKFDTDPNPINLGVGDVYQANFTLDKPIKLDDGFFNGNESIKFFLRGGPAGAGIKIFDYEFLFTGVEGGTLLVNPVKGRVTTALLNPNVDLSQDIDLINGGQVTFKDIHLKLTGVQGIYTFDQVSVGVDADDVVPVPPVPEPSSILSLLALGTLGAASTLKRKLKPSQSTEKETTKVS
jgi:hypothetical protein